MLSFFWVCLAIFAAGYVAAIFTWDRLHTLFIGGEAKAERLRQQLKDFVERL